MKQFLVILRGAPASGKTTIAKRLRNFDKKIVWLKEDNFKDFFGEDTEEQFLYAYKASIPVLSYLLDNGFSVVMDGIFRDLHLDILKQVVHEAEKRQVPAKVFQLTCPLLTLLERDRKRVEETKGVRKPIGDDILTRIYENIKNSPFPNAQTIDTKNHSIEECITIIEKIIPED
jgi:tRNA uridine 5-carbamoylmethylation protein Kti12